jgi:Ser/Thr protein kinase RdoA (MazF antagonist)
MDDQAVGSGVAPSAELLGRLGVSLLSPLGGRLNTHWLVQSRGPRLVLRRWAQPADEVLYELRLLERIAAMGWPVASAVAEPIEHDGAWWSLAPLLTGEPLERSGGEQRARGRLLAAFHADLARLHEIGQRGAWRRCERILDDPTLDELLADHERQKPEEARILRWHLERARERIAGLAPHTRPDTIIHGDFATWNLLYQDGRLSAILDFELAHRDHRIAEFALAWRGKYDAVIHGYHEVAPLEPEEWALLTPLWWAFLIEGACQCLRQGISEDGWTVRKLLERSPLMGPDAAPYKEAP